MVGGASTDKNLQVIVYKQNKKLSFLKYRQSYRIFAWLGVSGGIMKDGFRKGKFRQKALRGAKNCQNA